MTVAIYIRVSTTRQAEEGFSLAAQQKVLEDYCKQHKYIIHQIYADEGISGKDVQHRDAFKTMLQDAKERKFQAVLVWKLTRFTRSVRDLINTCDELELYNVALMSYSESFDTSTPSGRLMRNLLGVIAQWEREIIAENVVLANSEKVAQGHSLASFVLGYDFIEKDLVINAYESKVVQHIFELYIKQQSLSAVARQLNSEGYKSKCGNDYTPQSVLVILSNCTYCGYNRSKGKLFKGNQKIIINVETFNFTQKIIASNSRGRKRKKKLILLD